MTGKRLTAPFHVGRFRALRQVTSEPMHLFQTLYVRNQEHGGLVQLVVTPRAPFDAEE